MGPGRKGIVAVKAALTEQKDLDNKILCGRRKDMSKLTGDGREIVGAHSPRILGDPDFRILSQTVNADGTIQVGFKKLISSALPLVWSKNKSSTLAPLWWLDNQIFWVGEKVAKTAPVFRRARDGSTLHRDTIVGVQWEVILQGGKMTSSYPTGGFPSHGI